MSVRIMIYTLNPMLAFCFVAQPNIKVLGVNFEAFYFDIFSESRYFRCSVTSRFS